MTEQKDTLEKIVLNKKKESLRKEFAGNSNYIFERMRKYWIKKVTLVADWSEYGKIDMCNFDVTTDSEQIMLSEFYDDVQKINDITQ